MIKKSYCTSFVSFFLIILWLQVLIGNAQTKVDINMTNLGNAWEEYITNPGNETALKVFEILPERKEDFKEFIVQPEVRKLISEKITILQRLVYSSDRDAVKIAFRLFSIADEELIKLLEEVLGNLIKFNTRLFLEELNAHEELVTDLPGLVCSFSLMETSDNAQLELEKNIRLKSLINNEDKKLKSIKKKCIKILKKYNIE